MATTFFIRTRQSSGAVTLFARLQSVKQKINHKASTPLTVDVKAWRNSRKGPVQLDNFRKAYPELTHKMDELKLALDATLSQSEGISQQEFCRIIDEVIYRETRAARKAEEARRLSLNGFIEQFIEQISSGARQTDQGHNYAHATVKTIRQALKQFDLFQQEQERQYNFADIDMMFYYDFTAFLKKKGYSVNSIGKCIRQLKAVLHAAELEGYRVHSTWKDKKFKGYRIEVDSIYLTQEDLKKLMGVDLSRLSPQYEQVRDVFMIGVWTAQRISDYNNIHRSDFNILTKNVIREEPDPKRPGRKRVWVETQVITYLNVLQKKTGAKVAIPCNAPMKEILVKYDYQLPHLNDHLINRLIKEIARMAGLTQTVEIVTTKGGVRRHVPYEKWQLVHSHTARRTGATLMYLAGVDLYDIMKVTGHTSPAMLKKYIKADSLEVVEKLSEKYDYFK